MLKGISIGDAVPNAVPPMLTCPFVEVGHGIVSALDAALTQLRFNSFDAFADMVWWPQTLQLYAFAAGALLLGLACVRSINAVLEQK